MKRERDNRRWKIRYTKMKNNNVMSRYDHQNETSLQGIEHLSKEKKEKKEKDLKEKNHYEDEFNSLLISLWEEEIKD